MFILYQKRMDHLVNKNLFTSSSIHFKYIIVSFYEVIQDHNANGNVPNNLL